MATAATLLLIGAGASAQPGPQSIMVPNPGFEEGQPGEPPAKWGGNLRADATASTLAYRAVVDTDAPRRGRASVRIERVADVPDANMAGP